MTSLITGTWTLISSSAELMAGARRMTLRIHRLLQPGLLELSETDRRRLLSLQKRVDCLVHPLNFLLLWSKQRDSCVQQIVLGAQELLSDVCDFIDKYFPQDNGGSAKSSSAGAGIDSEQLEHFLRELDFACSSVSLAVSVAKATEMPAAVPVGAALAADAARGQASILLPSPLTAAAAVGGAGGGEGILGNGVSLSALLRASRRIQDMNGRSGDLCNCPGRLYTRKSGARLAFEESHLGPGSEGISGGSAWQTILSLATLKVVSEGRPKRPRGRYAFVVETQLPLSQGLGAHDDNGGIGGMLVPGEEISSASSTAAGLNSSGQYRFPIESSLDASMVTTGALGLYGEAMRCDLSSVGVDELVLVWTGEGTRVVDESGAELVDPVSPEENMQRGASFAWERPRPGAGAKQHSSPNSGAGTFFAFVFNAGSAAAAAAEVRGDGDTPITALDALYLARLCAYDDGQWQLLATPSAQDDNDRHSACPPHLSSSDEMLTALLRQAPTLPAGLTLPSAIALKSPCQ
mmetsp:Transcript_10394/g.22899  ORF Transcript_10394/g.22899 Transcript_10394/m.22899 type:complete len:521 (+) Transcript_10394:401-1963(+)